MGWILFAFLFGWFAGVATVLHCYAEEIRIGKMALCEKPIQIKINKGERLELFLNEKDTLYINKTKEDCPK